MSIKRYVLCERGRNGDFDAHMEESPDGIWVALLDHDRVVAELREEPTPDIRPHLDRIWHALYHVIYSGPPEMTWMERDRYKETLELIGEYRALGENESRS